MAKYKVWASGWGTPEEDSSEVEAYDADGAAEAHAENLFHRGGDYFKDIEISVRDGVEIKIYDVDVEPVLTFAAQLRKPRK